jgi:TonB family protein
MNRTQKKCFIAATGMHLLLLVILFVGPGFLTSKRSPRDLQMLDVIPANLIEAAFVGGGNPNALPPVTQPLPQPPASQLAAPQPERAPKPEPAKEAKPLKPEPDPVAPKLENKLRKPEVSLKPVVRKPTKPTSKPDTNSDNEADSQTRADAERRKLASNIARSLREGLSSSTTVDIRGPGGEAYAGYENVIQSIYQKQYDQALIGAGGIAEGHAEVEVSVTVKRDGTVLSAQLVTPSGNAALNKLVQRVLDKVTFIAPLPAASKDPQRTFNIIFDLKPKKAIG